MDGSLWDSFHALPSTFVREATWRHWEAAESKLYNEVDMQAREYNLFMIHCMISWIVDY